MLKVISLAMLAFLAGCSTMPRQLATDPMRQQNDWLAQQTGWSLSGRVAIKSPDESGQADIFWRQQSPRQYRIRMVAPFGGGTTLLAVDADGASVTLPDGKTYYADSLQELLAQGNDWVLPVAAVRYWLFGLPAPDIPVRKLDLNPQQMPGYLEQGDWRIRFKSYRTVHGHPLPAKLFMQQTDFNQNRVEVRLVIRQWQGLQ